MKFNQYESREQPNNTALTTPMKTIISDKTKLRENYTNSSRTDRQIRRQETVLFLISIKRVRLRHWNQGVKIEKNQSNEVPSHLLLTNYKKRKHKEIICICLPP
jgi:hypothetical protein